MALLKPVWKVVTVLHRQSGENTSSKRLEASTCLDVAPGRMGGGFIHVTFV